MKKRVVSVLLAAALVFTNMSVVNAAESPESVQIETVSEEASEAGVKAEGRSTDLAADEKAGLFITLGGKTISSVTDNNFNKTLTIPSGITVSDGASIKMAMQNMPGLGITDLVTNQYNMAFNISPISLDDLITNLRDFQSATVNGTIAGQAFSYSVSGQTDGGGTTISSVTSNAAGAYQALADHLTPTSEAVDGMKMEKGAYIQIGKDKMEYDGSYQGEVIIGDSQTSMGELQDMIRSAFRYRKVDGLKDAQIAVCLPKGSYISVGGKSGRLTADTLIKISGLKDGYDIVNTDTGQTVLKAMLEARTSSEMLQTMLRSVNSLAAAADGSAINMDVSFSAASVSGIVLNKTDLKLGEGQNTLLIANVIPGDAFNRTVSWKSSDEQIATVKDGKVTGVSSGTAVITATTLDGGFTAECGVSVQKAEQPDIPGTEGKKITYAEIGQDAVSGETLTEDAEKQLRDMIINTEEAEAVIIRIPVSGGKTPSITKAIFETSMDAELGVLVIQTVAKNEDAKSIAATYTFDVSGTVDLNVHDVKTGITTEVAADKAELIRKNMPADAKMLELELEHNGKFPAPVTVSMYVGGKFNSGETIYLYYLNSATGKLELVGNKGLIVDGNGRVTFVLTHASTYVFSNKMAKTDVAAAAISLSSTAISMKTGETKQLTATVIPADTTDKTVTWTSSNVGVVCVADGSLTALKAGKATVTARTANGKTASCTVTVTLAEPSGFKVTTAGMKKIKLSWKKVQGASRYDIYRATSRDGKYKRIKKVTSTSYINKNLKMGSKYYYKIKAVSGSKSSAYTEVKSAYARLVAPSLTVKAGKKSANLKWKKLKSASGYTVSCKRGENGAYRLAATLKSKKNSVKVKKLKSKKVYYFKVRGYKLVKGKRVYGEYSKEIKVKVK